MLKKLLAITTIFILLFAIVGCQTDTSDDPGTDDPVDTPDDGVSKIIMITDTGGIHDKSFNQSAWEGLQTLVDKYPDVEFNYILSNSETEYASNMRTAVDSGSDLTWAVGFMLADDMAEIADSMPDAKFGIIDVDWLDYENLVQVAFKEHEGSFLVGLVAGMTTESNKVAFVGGMSGDLIKRFEVGFRAGVKAVNPDAEIQVAYVESWDNTQIAKETADTMFDQGADVIYHAAGGAGVGVFESAKARGTGPEGFWTIGVDRDQYEEAPDNMLTSMFKNVGGAMAMLSERLIADGIFNGGEVLLLGLAEDGVGVAPTSDITIPEEIREDVFATIEEYTEMIKSGELVVPATEDQFEEYMGN
jgi:basic membrane protein A